VPPKAESAGARTVTPTDGGGPGSAATNSAPTGSAATGSAANDSAANGPAAPPSATIIPRPEAGAKMDPAPDGATISDADAAKAGAGTVRAGAVRRSPVPTGRAQVSPSSLAPAGSGPKEPGPPQAGPPKPTGKARRRSPLWAKLLVGVGAVVMVFGLGTIALVKVGVHQIGHSLTQENLLGGAAAPANPVTGRSIDGPINILLVGSDQRPTQTQGGNSDTVIIAHIPASHDRMYLVSIPRDLGVRIPAFPKSHYPGGSNKINAAYAFGSRDGQGDSGGFQLLAQTIKDNFGITFNGGGIVNFSGFTDILQKLGGVTMYVDETTVSIHDGVDIKTGKPTHPYRINPNTGVPNCSGGYTFQSNPLKCALPGTRPNVYPKGVDHLTPKQALDFVRSRDGLVGTDYGRQRHQQQFIKALLKEAYSQGLNDPFKLNSFIGSIGKALVIDRGSASLEDWIFTLKGITPDALIAIKTNDGQTVGYDGSAGPIAGSVQGLSPDSKALLAAVKADKTATDDNVEVFLQTHQDWAANK
jgi:polyisoprenyl-teichoic acid--peptidoglycan teichoic acid transferase